MRKGIVASVLLACAVLGANGALAAADTFKINHIRFNGLKRISSQTALSYLPVHVHGQFKAKDSKAVIAALYGTGYFEDVKLYRKGDSLVIKVKEWPTIGKIHIEGNKEIGSKSLEPVLKDMGIQVGNTFDPSKMNRIVQGLVQQYKNIGYSAISVVPSTEPLANNRVAIKILIKEGDVSVVHAIKFIGNKHFNGSELRGKMAMKTKGWLSWFSSDYHYSPYLLDEDLDTLRAFYKDSGYLKARIEKESVETHDDGVLITLKINEGERYRVSGFTVTGKTLGFESELLKLVHLKVNGYYSQKDIIHIQSKLSEFIANKGYAFPHVHAIPKANALQHTVSFDFHISPGARVYVRNISIEGNYRTKDSVVRRELRQLEGALYSKAAIDRSKQRLLLLGYFQNATIENEPVSGHPEFVDLKVTVDEVSTGTARVQAGYDTAYGLVYGASITERNFLGSGNGMSLGFQNNAVAQSYNLGFSQPYYLPNGMSRSFDAYYTKVSNKPKYNLDSSYRQDGLGFSASYGMPLTEHTGLNFGYGYEHVSIKNVNTDLTDRNHAVASVLNYLNLPAGRNFMNYDDFTLSIGWRYNNLDRAIFPTAGFSTSVGLTGGVPLLSTSLPYYIASYSARWYQPLVWDFVLGLHTSLKYGDGYGKKHDLPFFKNFYMGGLGSMPGYEANSLGPWNSNSNTALGGNTSVIFGANLILPEFISPKVRTLITFTAGNIFNVPYHTTYAAEDNVTNLEKLQIKNLRTSVGVMFEWFSPMGMIDLGLSVPMNKKAGDQERVFDFSFGTSF